MMKVISSIIFLILCFDSSGRLFAQSATVIEAARKEGGKAVVYGSLESDEFEAIKNAFQNKTGLELEIWRASGTKTMDRVVSEYRAGKPAYDAVLLNANVARLVASQGMLAKYISPAAAGYPKESIDPVLGPSYRNVVIGVVYNKSMINPADVPKTFEDIVRPPFKGKIAMPDPSQHLTTTQWLVSLPKIIGKERADSFVRNLAGLKPTFVESFIPSVERVTGGELPIAITQVMYAYTYAVKGAPVDYVRFPKMMGDTHYALLSNKAPHPNAGKAFIDYLLGDDSLRILARMGEFVNRKGIYPPLPDADKIQFVPMENFSIKEYEEKKNALQKLFTS
ncbi:MAG TPA: extracellular solute-binding protein [Candidatus Binatia bacterium]|jgi:iron(III) transport system substrate-binding protein